MEKIGYPDPIQPRSLQLNMVSANKIQFCTRNVFFLSLAKALVTQSQSMMTSSNGNIFRVANHLCGEFKGQWRGALMFPLICDWINGWVNNREAGDLRRHHAHYDVIAKKRTQSYIDVRGATLKKVGKCIIWMQENVRILHQQNKAKQECAYVSSTHELASQTTNNIDSVSMAWWHHVACRTSYSRCPWWDLRFSCTKQMLPLIWI